tara:strand:- start:1091 stop:1393 length:303 start_codon:yes stop_codon:yes gene_type:complete
MPQDDDVITLTVKKEDEEMADQIAESGNLTVALTGMANEFGASAARRTQRADQIAADASSMWAVALTSPTVMASMGMRVAQESGTGRSRELINSPGTAGG